MHQKLLVPRPEKIDLCSWWRSHAPRGYSEVSSLLPHCTLWQSLCYYFIQLHHSKPPSEGSQQGSWHHCSCTLSQCDGQLWHIMSTSDSFYFFCICCCLLFLNLSSGGTLAIFKRYSLSSKLVWLCAHTPPTAESFYHWNEISWIA